MKARWPLTILAIAAIIIAVFAWRTAVVARTAAQETGSITAEAVAERRAVEDLQRRLADAEQRLTLARTKEAPTAARRIPGPPPERQPARTINERLRLEPEFQLVWLAKYRGEAKSRYGALWHKLMLSPEQVAVFEQNLIHREETRMDLNAIAAGQRREGGQIDPTLATLFRKAENDYAQEQRELLGEETYKRLADYERSIGARMVVNGWVGSSPLSLEDSLTAAQGESLVQLLLDSCPRYRDGGPFISGEVDWKQFDARIKPLVNEKQFGFLTTTEPPPPIGGRFQSEFYRVVRAAQQQDDVKTESTVKR